MLDYLLLALTGCLLGVITGLTPGLHVNTVCLLGLSVYPRLGLDPLQFSVAMVAMAVTHTFLDFIPAIFIGVPEEQTALSVLPAHKLVLDGKALDAVRITAYGSLLGLFVSLLLVVPAMYVIPKVYAAIRGFVVYVIIAAVALLILREKRKIWALTVFLLSGWFGLEVLNLKVISSTQVLFPVFAGLFGISTILDSLKSRSLRVPQKRYSTVQMDREIIWPSILGTLGGIAVGVLPAMSPSQVGILMFKMFGNSVTRFLAAVSAINTSDAIFSLVSLYTIGNPRSGVATMIGKIIEVNSQTLWLFLGTVAFTAAFATVLHLRIGALALRVFNRIDFRMLNLTTLIIVFALLHALTGLTGILIALLATAIGLIPIHTGVSRTHLMGVLIVPTVFYFLGIG
ncbi:MAG: tripartite tricarboxylate transporter permease [Candidatus Altiarchaeota archaeon]